MSRLVIAGMAALLGILPAASVSASPPLDGPGQEALAGSAPGATVEGILSIAREMNPEVAASALETEAALARVDAAGRLPDPMFKTEFKDIDRGRDSAVPDELGRVEYRIEQTFPLWGKLALQKDVARARAGVARDMQRAAELAVAARIKTVFAEYFAAFEGARLSQELSHTVATVAAVTRSRYAQGIGEQDDAIRSEVERTRLRTELIRFEADQRRTAARLNALMNRDVSVALTEPAALRPVPTEALTLAALLDAGRSDNPEIGASRSQIIAAEGDKALVGKSWYPDVTLGVAFQQFVDEDRRSPGYEAMIGVEVPLQWGLREAWEREATANLAVARKRHEAADTNVRGDLTDAFWSLDGARRSGEILQSVQLPQAKLAFQAALRGYEQGRSSLNTVLDTEQQVYATMLRLLASQVEQQARLAEIERLIGRDL
ncbi:MAG: TolC family protein [Rhodospirillales bacterium]